MCKIRVSQANSCQDYFLSASVTPTSRPAVQRRLTGMKFTVKSRMPEGLPPRSNKAIYGSSSICVRYRERWRIIIGSIFGSLVRQVITLYTNMVGIQQKWMVLVKIVDKKWCCSSSWKISGFVQSFDWRACEADFEFWIRKNNKIITTLKLLKLLKLFANYI